jgi:hypothetical protein
MRTSITCAWSIILFAGAAGAVDITTCGDTVPSGDTGVLLNDLLCPTTGPAVIVEHRGTLKLVGHTIEGGSVGVDCIGARCAVDDANSARGLILGAAPLGDTQAGVRFLGRARLDNVEIRNAGVGVQGPNGKLDIVNSIVEVCESHCIEVKRIVAEDLAIDGAGGDGINVKTFKTDMENGGVSVGFSGGNGITAARSFYGLNIESTDNVGDGISAHKVKGEDISTYSNGGAGTRSARPPRILRLSSELNQGPGVVVAEGGGRFIDANLENNELATQPEGAGIDLLTKKKPKVVDEENAPAPTTCDHSASIDTLVPWGVCEFD